MKRSFCTDRLRVYETSLVPVPGVHEFARTVFLAFRTDVDCPYPVCICTVWGSMVEMIETNDLHRRKGLAAELWLGLEKLIPLLHGDPVSVGGKGLLNSVKKRRRSRRSKARRGQP